MGTALKIKNAFDAMRALGIEDKVVKPVLMKLLKLYEENWALIEDDHYRALADAIFEYEETPNKSDVRGSGTEPSPKRMHREPYEQITPTMDTKSTNVIQKDTQIRHTHESVVLDSSGKSLGKRVIESNALSKYRGKNSISSHSAEETPAPISVANSALLNPNGNKSMWKINDITKGSEKLKISLIDEIGCSRQQPRFSYIQQNTVYQDAYLHFSLARIGDEDCCPRCSKDCLSSSIPCACARETGGEFAYTKAGFLREEFLSECISMKENPQEHHFVFCQDCPIERSSNGKGSKKCKGHLMRRFIKECWRKCGCSMQCGNRVVQRGIVCNLQVFLTEKEKGWGVRSLEELPKGAFVCEYVGEILTNMELHERNCRRSEERHTYPVLLDADWASEGILKDEEALCLDATSYGNVARFVNHRCGDANLIDVPVAVETLDHHYYHLAFFTTRKVNALEELTWDYGIDFDDDTHPIKAFKCRCGSSLCRDKKQKVPVTRSKRTR